MYYLIQTYSVSMIDLKKDVLACTHFEAIDIFTLSLTLNYTAHIVPETLISKYTVSRLHPTAMLLFLIFYHLRYGKK